MANNESSLSSSSSMIHRIAMQYAPNRQDSKFIRRRRRMIPFRTPLPLVGLVLLVLSFVAHPASSARISSFFPTLSSATMARTEAFRLRGGAAASKKGLVVQDASLQPTISSSDEAKTQNRTLLLIRVLFLTFYGSLGSIMPYLPVYYHSLGHGGLIIGMLGAVKPLTTFIVAPFWGILSDGTGDRFRILYFTFLVSVVGQILVAVRHDFYYLVVMVFVTAFFNAPVKSLIDSMVMDNLPDRRYYGRLRLWGQMGFGLGSSGAGILLSKSKGVAESILSHHSFLYKCWQNLTGYKLLFFTYAALSIPTWMCLKAFERIEKEKQVTVTKKAHKEGARIGQGLKLLVHNADALLFFFLVFVVGVSSGCIENFAYVRMREVGGSGKEMGLSRLVSSVAGAPMFWFSGPLTEMLGADRVLSLSLLSYAVRFFIYAFMRNPYHGLPAEAMRGVTFAAFWSTSTIYAHRISPPGMSATMLMFLNAMYGGLGQSLGAIIGGKLQSKFGTVKTFVYSGIFDLCFVGFLLLYLGLRKDSSFRNATPIGMDLDDKKTKNT